MRGTLRRGRNLRPWVWGVVALSLLLWPVLSPSGTAVSRLALAPDPNPRFGIVFVDGVTPDSNQPYANGQARYDKAKPSGAAFTRWPIYWHLIETSRDFFNYASQDEVADLDVRNGFETNAILMGTPSWGGVSTAEVRPHVPAEVGSRLYESSPGAARLAGSAFMAGSAGAVPVGLDLPPVLSNGAINQDNRWAYYVFKTVRRYMPGGELAQQRRWPQGKGIRYWEMWNEPDFVWGNGAPVFWEGGVQNYYRLLKVGYLAAKAADPQATVVFGGMQYWSDTDFFRKVLDQIMTDPDARARNYFFDAVAFHLYINPYNILDVGQWARSEMTRRGMSKPVWINETNIPVYDDPGVADSPFCPGSQGTMDEQASFVIQAGALAIAAQVERIFAFQLYDDYVGFREYFGLSHNDGTNRPSYTAYQVAATYLADPGMVSRTQLENGAVDSVSFLSLRQGKVTVLWNTSTAAKTVSLTASTPTAQLIDKAGNVQTIPATNNRFSVILPPKARYNISGCTNRDSDQPGSPYILVERVNMDLSSRVNPLPDTTTLNPFTVSWSRLDSVGGSATYDVQYRIGRDGQWQDWLIDTALATANFGPAQGGRTYYFRSRAKAGGLVEPYPDGDGDTFTTVRLLLTGRVVDNRGRPVSQATVAAATPSVSAASVASTDGQGVFSLELPANGTYQVAVSKQGFGALPPKAIGVTTSLSYDFALPPADNVVQNWGFESGLAGWVTSGSVVTQTFRHTGEWGGTISRSGTVSQTVTLLGGNGQSTLAFFYRTPSLAAGDRLEVVVAGNRTVSYVFPLSNNTWQQGWVDTSGLRGPVEIRFRYAGAGDLWLDEVSLGSSPYWTYLPVITQAYSLDW